MDTAMTETILAAVSGQDLTVDPIERSETVPSAWYTGPAFDELDREAVFSRIWHGVGHISQLRKPGDHLAAAVAGCRLKRSRASITSKLC